MLMNVRDILNEFKEGNLTAEEAEKQLRLDYIQTIGNHTLFDKSRFNRKGVPEIIFGEGKSPVKTAEIACNAESDLILISRASPEHYNAVHGKIPTARYASDAKMILIGEFPKPIGLIGIMAAGTSDIQYAEEARLVAAAMGVDSIISYDVGIAAFHRFLDPLKNMLDANVDAIVVAAGMEGALASIVSSFSSVPVIGLPTAVGYGFGGEGETALRSMLQSCSLGIAVVNIGNGVGAGVFASMISLRCRRPQDEL